MGAASGGQATARQVLDAVVALVQAQTWVASRQVMLGEQKNLLGPEADTAFGQLMERNAANPAAVSLIEQRHALVIHAREVGIEATYAELITQDYVDSLVKDLRSPTSTKRRRVDVARALIELSQSDLQRAHFQFELARSLLRLDGDEGAARHAEGVALLHEALKVITIENERDDWLGALQELAIAYRASTAGDHEANLGESIRYAELAVTALRGTPDHVALAAALHIAGDAYRARKTDKLPSRARAADCYREALGLLRRDENAAQWGLLQVSLADTLLEVAGSLARADDETLGHYEAALEYYSGTSDTALARGIGERIARCHMARAQGMADSEARLSELLRAQELLRREDDPEEWARLQHNLAETYRVLVEGDTASNIESAIEHFRLALEVFTADAYPRDFGLAANSMGAAYLEREKGERSENIEQALEHLEAALFVRPREQYPAYWAKTQLNMGIAYFQRIQGDRVENVDRAIEHLRAALDEPAAPWAGGKLARPELLIGKAYGERYQGFDGRREPDVKDAEQAIEHFERGLAAEVSDVSALERGEAEQLLAMLYEFRKTGARAENLERALGHYQAALEQYERVDFTHGIALCHYWIGSVIRKSGGGSEATSLATALEHFRIASDMLPQDSEAMLRADVSLEFADALYDVSVGDRGENLESAVQHYETALAAIDPAMSGRWLRANSGLGVALLEWSGGDRAANLERAIVCQQAVLAAVSREQDPRSWALAHHNLGNVYSERTQGDRAQNLEEAIGHFNDALTVFTREAFPEDWAMVTNSLAGAYQFRSRGDVAENLEEAIRLQTDALQVYTQQAFPADWAMTLHNLANAYLRRIEGYRPENIESGIQAHEASLCVRTREAMPFYWAMTQMNLGNAYLSRDYGDSAENRRTALEHFERALEVYTRESSPKDWAWAQLMIAGNATKASSSVEDRIARLNSVLEVYEKDSFPERWALAHNSLALIYREKANQNAAVSGSGRPGARSDEAIEHLQLALEVLLPESFPDECRKTRTNLADEYLLGHEWEAAVEAYERAIEVSETMLAAAYTEQGRLEEMSVTNQLHTHYAYALLQLGRIEDSLVQLDAGRTRRLAENLAQTDADLSRLPPQLRERLRSARNALRSVEADLRVRDEDLPAAPQGALSQLSSLFPNAPKETLSGATVYTLSLREARIALGGMGLRARFSEDVRKAREALDALVREALQIDPEFMHAGIEAAHIPSLVPAGGALVAFVLTPVGSAAWVIPTGASRVDPAHIVPLAQDADASVRKLLVGSSGRAGWLNSYLDSRGQKDVSIWQEMIESTTLALWQIVMEPVQKRLEALGLGEGTPILLMPQSDLALLPLHAAWRERDGARRAFLDDHPVTYAPSLYALEVGRRRLTERSGCQNRLLAVVNATQDLPYTVGEGEAAAGYFDSATTQVLIGDQGTEAAVLAAAHGATYLHFATHGLYDWRDVMRSFLALAGRARLTLARVTSTDFDLEAARLVVLSACETGFIESQRAPDEFLGFPAAFMEGGAAAVVSALWSVNDLSTALLFEEFYRRHLGEGEDVASALRGAQLWLRGSTVAQLGLAQRWESLYRSAEKTNAYAYRMMRYCRANPDYVPYAAPYFWAAFTFSGA